MTGIYELGLKQHYGAVHRRLHPMPPPVRISRAMVTPVEEPAPVVLVELVPDLPAPQLVEYREPLVLPRVLYHKSGPQPLRAPYRGIDSSNIKRIVARQYGFTCSDLDSQVRCQPLVSVRHVAVYLVHRHTRRTPGQIGRLFGNRDHTTVLNSTRKVAALRETCAELDTELAYLESVICGGAL